MGRERGLGDNYYTMSTTMVGLQCVFFQLELRNTELEPQQNLDPIPRVFLLRFAKEDSMNSTTSLVSKLVYLNNIGFDLCATQTEVD